MRQTKKVIVEAEYLIEFHFTIGMLIRNNWLYDRSEEEPESLNKSFSVDASYFEADDLSSTILEAYKKIETESMRDQGQILISKRSITS